MIELSKRMSRVHTSPIREMLKVTERPDVLSFAGGLPAPEMFPVEAMARAHAEVLAQFAANLPRMRELLAETVKRLPAEQPTDCDCGRTYADTPPPFELP